MTLIRRKFIKFLFPKNIRGSLDLYHFMFGMACIPKSILFAFRSKSGSLHIYNNREREKKNAKILRIAIKYTCDPSREKGSYGNWEKYRPWSDCAVRAV